MQVEHAKHLFDSIDLVAGYDIVGLAERPHNRKNRFEQLRLHNAQAAKERLTQQEASAVADEASDNEPRQTTGDEPNERTDKCESHAGLLLDVNPGRVMTSLAFLGDALRLGSRGLEIGRFLNRTGR